MLSVAFVLPLLAVYSAALPPKPADAPIPAHVQSAPEAARRRLPSVTSRSVAVIATKRVAFLR
jgi:hypothetical protein